MPSPTLNTSPTSLTWASAPKFWISRFRMAEISEGWIFMSLSSHGRAQTFEFRAQRRIDHARADLHHETTKERRIDPGVKARLTAKFFFQHALQFLGLRIAQRLRRRNLGIDFALLFGDSPLVCVDDPIQRKEAPL